METVPWEFIENVCLHLKRETLRNISQKPSRWGKVCMATSEKIHTLRVLVGSLANWYGQVFVAAVPVWPICGRESDESDYNASSDEDYRFDPHNLSEVVPLSRVNPKFITNFKIEEIAAAGLNNITTSWKEITLDELERLVNIIRPVRSERHPLRYDSESLNTLELLHNQLQITSDLISKRLPVDTFAISSCVFDEAYGSRSSASHAEHFIKNAGPLYRVSISDMEERPLPESALDTLIDKFIPINRGTFYLEQSLNKEQINRLFDKCATANKEVVVNIGFGSLNLEGLVDYDKYYWEKVLLAGGGAAMSVDEDRRGLGLLLRHPSKDRIRWTWTDAEQLFEYFLR